MRPLFSDSELLDLIEHVYAAGCDPKEWPAFVTKVQATVPGSACHSLFDIEGTQLRLQCTSAGVPDEFVSSYVETYQYINPYNKLFARLPVGKIYTSGQLGSRGWLHRDEFFNDWLKPAGNFTHGAGMVLLRDHSRQLRFTLDLPQQLEHLEPAAVQFLERLKPHLLRSFSVNEKLAAAAVSASTVLHVLDGVEGAAIVLNGRGRVMALNSLAENIFRKGSLVQTDATGELKFRRSDYEKAYKAASAAAMETAAQSAPHGFSIMEPSIGEGTVVVLPLRPQSGNMATQSSELPRAIVVIARLEERPLPPKQLLQSLYGLTSAEAGVVLELTKGRSPQEVAEHFETSRSTVRNQLAAAMAKMGVHRQAELVARILTLQPKMRA